MRITYCWTEPSGYLAACVRQLAARPGVDVSLFTWEAVPDAPYSQATLATPHARVLAEAVRNDRETVEALVAETRPDVVVFSGWAHAPYVDLTRSKRLRNAAFVLGADTPIRFSWRQWIAPLKIGNLLRRVDAVLVPGERGYQLMRYWRVPERKIWKLLYGVDYDRFAGADIAGQARVAAWPRRFLFAGRYVERKGLRVLLGAYSGYRRAVSTPWPLTMCGTGPLKSVIAGREGVEDFGFRQPDQLAHDFQSAGVFVLPSAEEAWGQVIVEAAAAGLPIICSKSCGAGGDLVRDFHNGFLVATGDADALRDALIWMHHHADRLPQMGHFSRSIAAAYSDSRWADNQIAMATRLTSDSHQQKFL